MVGRGGVRVCELGGLQTAAVLETYLYSIKNHYSSVS